MNCELCGAAREMRKRAGGSPARFCSNTCRNRWHSLQAPRSASPDWKWDEVVRLRALLDENGIDWRAGRRADDRVIARRLINYGIAHPPEQWERKIADVLAEMREAGES